MTKDERFLIEIYRDFLMGQETLNPVQIAEKLRFKENLKKEVLKGLQKANLIKLLSPEEMILTDLGKEVARKLL